MPEFKALVEGYHRFRAESYIGQKARFDALSSHGQSPPVMIISCCDSRVDPATVFDTVPGQVFALRNVANLVPPYDSGGGLHGASAAIEFGVLGLGVSHIVVMGHGQCGGISAALAADDHAAREGSFVDEWMRIIADARQHIVAAGGANPQRALELAAIKVSLANLRSFPFIAEREAAGEIILHGVWFAIHDGLLHVLDEESGAFNVER